jgi:predicted component of type VI protein secretion system
VTLGTHAECSLRLVESDGDVAPKHVRIWRSGGRYMLHHLATAAVTVVAGQATDWAVLEPDDRITIGPHLIAFEVADGGVA